MMNNLTVRIRVYHLTIMAFFPFYLFHFPEKIKIAIWLFFKLFGQDIQFIAAINLFKANIQIK